MPNWMITFWTIFGEFYYLNLKIPFKSLFSSSLFREPILTNVTQIRKFIMETDTEFMFIMSDEFAETTITTLGKLDKDVYLIPGSFGEA